MESPGGVPADDPKAAIERQMAGQWTAMLRLMTQQGATRLDVVELAMATAAVTIETTAMELWPTHEAQESEGEEFLSMARASSVLREGLVAVRHKIGGTS